MRGWVIVELGRRVVAFSLVPALSVLSPLLVLPLIASRFGPAGWSAVAVGQSVGAAVSIVVGLSWPTIGAHLVASAPDDETRRSLYAESLVSRLLALAALAPLAVVVAALLSPAHWGAAGLAALAGALNGLTCAWYFVGTARPRSLLVNEAVVRLAATLAIALLLLAGAGLWVFGVSLLVGGVVTAILNHRTIAGSASLPRLTRDVARSLASRHGAGTGARMVYGIYSSASVSLVALVAPGAVPVFSAIDRVLKMGLNGLYALPQGVAGWVSAGGPEQLPRRAVRAAAGMAVLAVGIFAAGWLLFPLAMDLLYAGRAAWVPEQRHLAAVVLAVAFYGQALVPVFLVPAAREDVVYGGYVVAAALGTPLVLGLAAVSGVTGALIATVVVEVVLTGLLLGFGVRTWRRTRYPAARTHEADVKARPVPEEGQWLSQP
jgi:O-antigen/teichoic acid export membrane protein